jgi:hypothetical protein
MTGTSITPAANRAPKAEGLSSVKLGTTISPAGNIFPNLAHVLARVWQHRKAARLVGFDTHPQPSPRSHSLPAMDPGVHHLKEFSGSVTGTGSLAP